MLEMLCRRTGLGMAWLIWFLLDLVALIAGTSTFNILFILGLSALIRPPPLHMRTIRHDLPDHGLRRGGPVPDRH